MLFKDLRHFIDLLEKKGELKRIKIEVDPYLEITEISDRVLRHGGPALLFENFTSWAKDWQSCFSNEPMIFPVVCCLSLSKIIWFVSSSS